MTTTTLTEEAEEVEEDEDNRNYESGWTVKKSRINYVTDWPMVRQWAD